ncbi:hypothetical protein BJ165DRAFT_859967 [Panaeolus papilionaceus]|nr:hypothetical protein BJ165DRAFT_859967 [Panaeolus papilionaceus]
MPFKGLHCFRCSGAYVPWVNKGRQRSRLEQNNESLSTHNTFINRARGPSTIDGILKPNNSSAMPSYRPAPRDPSSLSKGFEAHTCAPPLPPTPQSQYHHSHQDDPSLYPIA